MKTNFTIRDVLNGGVSRKKLENTLELVKLADNLVGEVKMLEAVQAELNEFLKSVQVMKNTLAELAGEELTKSDIDTLNDLLEQVRGAFPKHLVLQYLGADVNQDYEGDIRNDREDDGEDETCDDEECLCNMAESFKRSSFHPQPFMINLSAPASADPAAIRASLEQFLAGSFGRH